MKVIKIIVWSEMLNCILTEELYYPPIKPIIT